jgi:hypothetical protein
MNDQDKSKSELIKELQQLREDNKKFRKSYEADIADRRIAEGAIRESETRFRNLFQEVQSVSVQGYDTDGNYQILEPGLRTAIWIYCKGSHWPKPSGSDYTARNA